MVERYLVVLASFHCPTGLRLLISRFHSKILYRNRLKTTYGTIGFCMTKLEKWYYVSAREIQLFLNAALYKKYVSRKFHEYGFSVEAQHL